MTQQHDYVWFLPHLLSKDFEIWEKIVNGSCSAKQFKKAIDGHFSLMYMPFGSANAPMQEKISVREWKDSYSDKYGGEPSYYAGFTYDAVWTYAKAAHKLLNKNKNIFSQLRNPEVLQNLGELIQQTNYQGLSGNVSFDNREERNGSRIIDLHFLQWRNNGFNKVGMFKTVFKINDIYRYSNGGKLLLNFTEIYWTNSRMPGDGRYDCRLSLLARSLYIDCNIVNMSVLILVCLFAFAFIFFVTFCFWRQLYNRKIKRSAEIMKMFGIDLLTPSLNKNNTLDKWEIPKEKVVINRSLGEGAFGMVYGGEAQLSSGMWTAVAVKTLKSGQSIEDRIDFLAEAEAMKKFDHRNVIKLLGVCLQNEPIYTIMEFMLYGDLKTYLLARRNMVKDKVPDECDISEKFLTLYAMDVAKGLAYLAQQKYVHRDLACRNCLINSYRVVKIADFGMARPTFESDYYKYNRKSVRKLFPVRWMPPETLTLGLFTPASDIWSFGIVVYEVISFGSYPYPGLSNDQVLTYVKNGNTPQIPLGVKPQLKGLLKSCWCQEASKRPTAGQIVEFISNYPRLLTPSLEVPITAIDISESQINQIFTSPPTNICETVHNSNSEYYSKITADGYSIMSPLLKS